MQFRAPVLLACASFAWALPQSTLGVSCYKAIWSSSMLSPNDVLWRLRMFQPSAWRNRRDEQWCREWSLMACCTSLLTWQCLEPEARTANVYVNVQTYTKTLYARAERDHCLWTPNRCVLLSWCCPVPENNLLCCVDKSLAVRSMNRNQCSTKQALEVDITNHY